MPHKNKRTGTTTAAARGDANSGRFAYEGLDRLLHERARLGILTTLAGQPEGVLFSDLKELCSLTDGNLSRHLQALHEAGVVDLWKRSERGRPQTLCRLSRHGRERFIAYLSVLESVVQDAAEAAAGLKQSGRSKREGRAMDSTEGWAPA